MDELEKRALKRCSHFLAEDISLTDILIFLYSKNIVTDGDMQLIETKQTDIQKNFCLVHILTKAGPNAFKIFIEALEKFGKDHLARVIINTVEDLKKGDIAEGSFAKRQRYMISALLEPEILNAAKDALKNLYKRSFRKVNPFSLPFTFDIENTWVSLALKKNWATDGQNLHVSERRIEDHCQLIREAFTNGNQLLLIEGRAACGKTSLMRRIAYDWANTSLNEGKKERIENLSDYKFVFYVEFRKIQGCEFATIANLIQDYFKHIKDDTVSQLNDQIATPNFCKENEILVLLDGFDESKVNPPCTELSNFFAQRGGLRNPLSFHVIISTRPGPLKVHLERCDILNSATVLGFDMEDQKLSYIKTHFQSAEDSDQKVNKIQQYLKESKSLNKIAETPLFLVFICLVYDKLKKNTIFELYQCIVWWLIDRYQNDNPTLNVPRLFGFELAMDCEAKWKIIWNHFIEFPLLCKLGVMSFELKDQNTFSNADLLKYDIHDVIAKVGFLNCEEKYDRRVETQFIFPHRTIQEFLAGGIYYYWPENEAVKTCLTKKYFRFNSFGLLLAARELATSSKQPSICMITKPVARRRRKKEQMNELEIFIWRAAFSFEKVICTRLEAFFQGYTYLSLELSSILKEAGSVKQLNNILNKCCNINSIIFYSLAPMKLVDRIDLSAMQSLNSFALDKNLFVHISSEKSDLKSSCLISLPNNVKLTEMILGCKYFSNVQCFLATMRYLAEHMNSEVNTDIVLNPKIKICFGGDNGIQTFEASNETDSELNDDTTHVSVSSILAGCHQSNISAVLQSLVSKNNIVIVASKSKHACFDIRFPEFDDLRVLRLEHFSFSKSEEKEPHLPFSTLTNLKFNYCNFELPALQAIVREMLNYGSNVNRLSFHNQEFESEDYFKMFFQILQECHIIEFLEISIITFQYDVKATEIFCDLVKYMRRLKCLKLSVNQSHSSNTVSLFIDKEKVMTAAMPRESFQFDFD